MPDIYISLYGKRELLKCVRLENYLVHCCNIPGDTEKIRVKFYSENDQYGVFRQFQKISSVYCCITAGLTT